MTETIADNAMENLIIKACGARSMTEYAKACGISPMHISRIKSGMCKPSKKMCIKLSSEPYVRQIGLSAEDFMKAAGYEDSTEIESTQSFERLITNSIDAIILGIISKKLLSQGIAFQMIPFRGKPDVDFAFEVLGSSIVKRLNICTMIQKQSVYSNYDRYIFFYFVGRLLTLNYDVECQYVMMMSDGAVFDELQNCAELTAVRANATIVLLDPENMAFMKEVHLGPEAEFISLLN